MSENDHYKWLELQLRLYAAASRRPTEPRDNDDAGGPFQLHGIFAQAGIFEAPPAQAANDLAALLSVLLLIWWWNCAKSCANLSKSEAVFCKINAGRFFGGPPGTPRQMGVPAFFPALIAGAISITSP